MNGRNARKGRDMESEEQKPSARFKQTALLLSCYSALLGTGITLWISRSHGSPGLLAWNPVYRTYFLVPALFGSFPLALALFIALVRGLFFRGTSEGRACRFFRALQFALACASSGLLMLACGMLIAGTNRVGGYEQPHLLMTPAPPHPLDRIALSSDPHFGSPKRKAEATERILDSIGKGGYDAFVCLGDMAETGFPGSYLEEAATAFAQGLGGTPAATLMGNHDAIVGGAGRYKSVFSRDRYWRADSGKVHLIALDLSWGTEEFDGEQKRWLEETLRSIPREELVIVLTHCFFYSSGYVDAHTGKNWFDHADMIETVSPILEEAGVDLVASGHNHYMEFLEHGKTAYAVIGAMGGKPDPEPEYESPQSRWFRASEFGFLDIARGDGFYDLTFRDVSGNALWSTRRGY